MTPKQYNVGKYVMGSTAGFTGDADFDIDLSRLPEYLTPGLVAMILGFEIKVTATFGTLASDPALFSYLLRSAFDFDLFGPGSHRMKHLHGWHEPLHSILRHGRVFGTRCANIPATGGGGPGSYPRTFTMHLDLDEPMMASRYAMLVPSIAFAKAQGSIRAHVYSAARPIYGAHLGVTACTFEITANIVEFPPTMVPLAVQMEESSIEGDKDTNPSPDVGAYLRLFLANSPLLAATADDVSAYTKINLFGDSGNYTVQDKAVDQLLRQFNEDISADPHVPFVQAVTPSAASPTMRSETRLLDPLENVDGKTRVIPLVYAKRRSDIATIPAWYGKKPALSANNDDTSGLPASVDLVFQRVIARTPAWTTAIVGALGPAALSRGLTVPPGYVDGTGKALKNGIDRNRVPLIIDGRK